MTDYDLIERISAPGRALANAMLCLADDMVEMGSNEASLADRIRARVIGFHEEADRAEGQAAPATECICYDGSPANYEGPQVECDVHGRPSAAYRKGVRDGRDGWPVPAADRFEALIEADAEGKFTEPCCVGEDYCDLDSSPRAERSDGSS